MQRYDDNELAKLKEELILNPPNMLVFCGDLCHMPYKADDIRFINTIKFVTEVVNICRKKNIQFRIIQGTSSHDGKIVEILSNIFSIPISHLFLYFRHWRKYSYFNSSKNSSTKGTIFLFPFA